MGDSNPRGLSPNTLSKRFDGGWEVFARVRLRRSARCADGSRDPWIGVDRGELLPKLLPVSEQSPQFLGRDPRSPVDHAMAVRAEQHEVREPGVDGTAGVKGEPVVDLDVAMAARRS